MRARKPKVLKKTSKHAKVAPKKRIIDVDF
jgi:hypothetical protein